MALRKYTVLQLARKYLPVVAHDTLWWSSEDKVGTPPSISCMLVRVGDGLAIHYVSGSSYHDLVLHELAHAIAGPSSLTDEGVLMVVQWALMKRLRTQDYNKCREELADYILDDRGRGIGYSDYFCRTKAWKAYRLEAVKRGLVTRGGRVPRTLRVHPDWAKRRRRRRNAK